MLIVFALLGAVAAAPSLTAEELDDAVAVEYVTVDDGWDLESLSPAERAVNLLTARTTPRGTILFIMMHRARESFADDGAGDFLGLDRGGLKVALGLRYGLREDLDVGTLRLNGTAEVFDTYEFDARYRLLSEEEHPLNLAVRAGVSWFAQPDAEDASGYFGQLLLDRRLGRRLSLGAGCLYHTDSSGARKSTADDDESVALGLWAEFRVLPWLAVDAEVAASLAGYGEDRPAASVALKAFTYGHTFTVAVTNTQYVGADGVVANAWRETDEPIIGFGLTREFRL
jgi:hypothetical protein